MGPTWVGPVGPRWAPCWPHEQIDFNYLRCRQINPTKIGIHVSILIRYSDENKQIHQRQHSNATPIGFVFYMHRKTITVLRMGMMATYVIISVKHIRIPMYRHLSYFTHLINLPLRKTIALHQTMWT